MFEVKIIASGSTGNCYRVSDGITTVLLDAGVSIARIREGCKFKLHEIAACFVTHYHGDHSKAVKELIRYGIPVFMTEGERAEMKNVIGIKALHKLDGQYLLETFGTLSIQPFKVMHDTPEPVGFLIASSHTGEKLLYFTDTYYLPGRFGTFDYLIGEVNYNREMLYEHIEAHETGVYRAKRLFSSHMSLENFLEFLRANDLSKLKKIWICHMSDSHGDEKYIKESIQKETGVEIEVC